MEQQKSCENCYYFYQHYFKNKRGRLFRVENEGHCANGNWTKSVSKKIVSKQRICEFWTPEEIKKAEMRENICKLVSEMKKRLDEVALILKDD